MIDSRLEQFAIAFGLAPVFTDRGRRWLEVVLIVEWLKQLTEGEL